MNAETRRLADDRSQKVDSDPRDGGPEARSRSALPEPFSSDTPAHKRKENIYNYIVNLIFFYFALLLIFLRTSKS